jgi:hypothetical protein
MPVLRRNVGRDDDSDLVPAEEIDDRLLHLASLVAVVQQDVTASLEHREPILEVAGASIIGVVSSTKSTSKDPTSGERSRCESPTMSFTLAPTPWVRKISRRQASSWGAMSIE